MLNNVEKGNNNDSKKILTIVVLIMTLMVCTTSATYAYFALTATNDVATGTAATVGLSLTVQEAALKTTNTGVMVPQLETSLGLAMDSTNKCIDGNGNIICKVYTITVTNESDAGVKVNGTIQFSLSDPDSNDNIETFSMTNLKWKRATAATTLGTTTGGSYNGVAVGSISYNNGTVTSSSIVDLTAGTACTVSTGVGCTDVSLTAGGNEVYHIVIWINETNTTQTDSGKWKATINFQGENGKGVTSTITS